MTRKAIVTAGTRGLGFEVAAELSRRDHAVTIIGRDVERGKEAAQEIGARFVQADLSVLGEVRALGARLAEEGPWHLLVNNVGGMWSTRWETADGIEASFAVNHLSPLVLTEALLDSLVAGSRIVDVTSSSIQAALMLGTPVYDDVDPGEYYGMAASGRAKLAHLAYNRDLASRLRGSGVSVFAADPGAAATPNAAAMTPEILPPPLRPQWDQIRQGVQRPAAEAARSIVFAATDPSLEGETGLVIDPGCRPSEALRSALTGELAAAATSLTERVLKS
ncbi:SDR family NAD(P)-dependent oxidoreductase [Amycolatopsis thermophila]|uniref:NAD(P)-dependent dehydrogenase (Short-subunit alcohol dehydrogenase family) n=1 Tax=Amycolatopsis thermophila TaxID=206084 RepID=A0ABU0ETY5_9PSEU|nr:SDR family NAD(P)-dependent oxidoreductase [Amycolatopsis thermophila]MDQ0378767.1 NAD(P)-dependent dehydrogenase (short-subunit alcohol dehydrogenase family) [Amycolatopsis thermophila]